MHSHGVWWCSGSAQHFIVLLYRLQNPHCGGLHFYHTEEWIGLYYSRVTSLFPGIQKTFKTKKTSQLSIISSAGTSSAVQVPALLMIPQMQTIPRSSYQKSLSFRLLFTGLREAWMSYSQMLQPRWSWKTLQLGSTASDSGGHRGQMHFRGRWSAVRKGTDLHLPVSRNWSHNLQCFAGSMPITAGSGPPGP